MAEKSISDLGASTQLPSGDAHTLNLDTKLTFVCEAPSSLDGVELVVLDANGQEQERIPASSATSQGSTLEFQLDKLDRGERHWLVLRANDVDLSGTIDLKLDDLERALAAGDASGDAMRDAKWPDRDDDGDGTVDDDDGQSFGPLGFWAGGEDEDGQDSG